MPDLDRMAREIADQRWLDTFEKHALAKDILAALRRVEAETREWRPIETAPKDGTRFMASHEISGVISISWFGKTSHVPLYGWCEGDDPEDIDLWNPTHWMPLPPPPRKEGDS